MLVMITALLVVIFVPIYTRYFPVHGVKCLNLQDIDKRAKNLVDVRDFNQSYKDSIQGSINIPVAYFKRSYREIPSGDIHIVASSRLDKNISVRFLRGKGLNVIGYTITECNCKKDECKKHHIRKENVMWNTMIK
ncbi:hypothetical protein [Bacillus sp. J33]|uniref:hypothetical protein n=1 Tax=Bacillus sp. J33 TaxID=935836 RepID=UPI0006854163|nr:hypothetical protein [Bacillus sp. J33]